MIVATGGVSYPLTGSTGDGYRLAEQAGDAGNTRFPRSTFTGTPRDSKKAMTASLSNWLQAL